ncbi:MAG TPA: hypothetical protein DCM51_03055 [Actinobacteria bacterium]|nr:hypothetical protein [Actinomycetota bacterium]
MTLPLHLLFPLFSSVVFVFGMLNAKRAISLGASPWTSTVLANFWLAAGWGLCGVLTGQLLPAAGWWQAALVALSFVAGQVFTYFAYQFGDVSVATPVFGVKVIIVAVLLSGLISVVVLRGARTRVKAPTAGRASTSETSAGETFADEDSAGKGAAGDEQASATPRAQARSPRPGLLRRFNERIDAMAAKEDAADDALRAAREKE